MINRVELTIIHYTLSNYPGIVWTRMVAWWENHYLGKVLKIKNRRLKRHGNL